MSGSDGNGGGSSGSDGVQTGASSGLAPLVHNAVGNRQTLPDRSSSPGVKRRASELEGFDGQLRGGSESSTDPVSDTKPASQTGSSPQPSPRIQNGSPRHARGVSVDMLERERLDLTKLRTVTSSMEDSPSSTADPISASNYTETPGSRDLSVLSKTQSDLPPLDEQVAKVRSISSQPLKDGQIGFIVASQWLTKVLSRSSDGIQDGKYDKSSREGEIGPVDNSQLVAEGL